MSDSEKDPESSTDTKIPSRPVLGSKFFSDLCKVYLKEVQLR